MKAEGICELGAERIFGTEERRRLQTQEPNHLYSSPNIWVTKSRKMRWMGHVASMKERNGA
jgi:hypothetical protein